MRRALAGRRVISQAHEYRKAQIPLHVARLGNLGKTKIEGLGHRSKFFYFCLLESMFAALDSQAARIQN
jgi:hypothetical protein